MTSVYLKIHIIRSFFFFLREKNLIHASGIMYFILANTVITQSSFII